MLLNFYMKKLFLIFAIFAAFIGICMPTLSTNAESLPTYEVCANYANLYESPSLESTVLAVLKNKTQITPEFDGNTPKAYTSENFVFFKVAADGKTGFVLSDFVALEKDAIESIPNFNAKTSNRATVFEKAENGFVESNIILEKNTEIFLYEGFDNKSYNSVAFVYNNEIRYGYLHADDISPDGINPIIITCIALIVALVSIIFALVFMKRKKVKLKKVGTKT